MSRKLILCLDGTNNKYAATNTNVVKLYAMLDRSQDDQHGYYQPGIGTFAPPGVWEKSRRWIITRLDLAVAWLLEDHVSDAYRYLMRYYQAGDEIFIFGFSRGAYSARVLAAMLYKVGLLSPGNEELLPFAWDAYKNEKDINFYIGFRDTFSRKVRVRFLGLWDTVSSVGWAWNPGSLQFTQNNPIVETVRHAVSLDERRAYFVQNLWARVPPPEQSVLQVWFAGVHCDVGGGYAEMESGLSKFPLAWMVQHAEATGLRFNNSAKAAILPATDTQKAAAANPAAIQHESLSGWWWIPEFLPKRIKDPGQGFKARWILHKGRHRYVADGSLLHTSVLRRMEIVPTYRPRLPNSYTAVA